MSETRPKFGTREWAEVNANIYLGCEHNCRYCYARNNALKRFKKIKSEDEWKNPVLQERSFKEKPKLYKNKRIMFPTQHDITPDNVFNCIVYLTGWLEKGNNVLIVSKPHMNVVKELCDNLTKYRNQIVFRFTIGSPNNDVLKFWEPDAPDYEERKSALIYAFDHGYVTSVSCEPILDEDIELMVYELLPFITDTIWLGKMNFIKQRVDTKDWKKEDFDYMKKVESVIKDEFIRDLYDDFKDNPKVKWKESIKQVLGLPDEEGVA